jgi:hypothetical protein
VIVMAKPATQPPSQGITTNAVRAAAVELDKMRGSLKRWLKYRDLNDRVVAGAAPTKLPPGIAKQMIARSRDLGVEQDLANKLHALLSELYPGTRLPSPDVAGNPTAAVELARIALAPAAPAQGAQAVGGVMASHPWLLPVLIVGGLLIGVTTAIKSAADVAMEREKYACIQAGACTDYGFWLKAGGITVLAWFAWKELGLGDFVKGALKKGRS